MNKKQVRIQELIKNIKNIFVDEINKKEKVVVVVEGKKDVKALEFLGISKEKIITCSSNSKDRIIKNFEKIKEVVIFTDLDQEGKKIEKNLKFICQSYGIVPNVELKRKIFSEISKITGKSITAVEDLLKIFENV